MVSGAASQRALVGSVVAVATFVAVNAGKASSMGANVVVVDALFGSVMGVLAFPQGITAYAPSVKRNISAAFQLGVVIKVGGASALQVSGTPSFTSTSSITLTAAITPTSRKVASCLCPTSTDVAMANACHATPIASFGT